MTVNFKDGSTTPPNQAYKDGWDRIFGKKKHVEAVMQVSTNCDTLRINSEDFIQTEIPTGPIPVTVNFKQDEIVGWAKLSMHEGEIFADISVNKGCEDEFSSSRYTSVTCSFIVKQVKEIRELAICSFPKP